MSPTSQKKLIEIIGKRIIQKQFKEEIKDAQYHSVLVDEVTNSNNEILSICIRYVNKEKQVREVFLDFLSLERITGECIGQTILNFYEEKGISIRDCRGQCYDGAPNMQSLKKRAGSFILKKSPKAYTTHCCSHSLILPLASTCKIPIITNIVEIYKSVLIYFNTSVTNCSRSFQDTQVIKTGLSDFHKMNVTVLKMFFTKQKHENIFYRNYIKTDNLKSKESLNRVLMKYDLNNIDYQDFHEIVLSIFNAHAPLKKKHLRANHASFVTKEFRKAVMKRAKLRNDYLKKTK